MNTQRRHGLTAGLLLMATALRAQADDMTMVFIVIALPFLAAGIVLALALWFVAKKTQVRAGKGENQNGEMLMSSDSLDRFLSSRSQMWNLAAIMLCLLAAPPARAVELRLLDSFSGTFPATTTVWRVQADAPASTSLMWELMLSGAVVDRGQRLLDATETGQPIELAVRIPPLREGVSGQATLIVEVTAEGQSARLVHPVWILPADPWSGLRTELAQLPLRLYENGQALSEKLHSAGLRTTTLRNTAAIAALTNGLVLVAGDLSFRAHRGLVDSLLHAAAGGARVILLAPSDGPLPLPGHKALAGLARPAVRMEGAAALLRLDRRLDVQAWPGKLSAIASSFLLSAERRQPEAVWSAGADGWAWLDLDFRGRGGGRLLAVGWAPTRAWDSSPAPRHALVALIRHVLE